MIRCGIYETDITPMLGMEIPGYFEVRNADGVREELYAEAVYFENDGRKAVIISCDTILVPMESCEKARNIIAQRLGMSPDGIMICATHSHTSAPVETWGDFVHIDDWYVDFLERRIIDSACLAAQRARDVKLSFALGYEDKIAYYRNYISSDGSLHTWRSNDAKPYGEIDPEVGVLRIDNADGTQYGVIVNYACHCDCVGGKKFSSDYPGEMRKTLRKLYGESFMPVFINGFCGNINHCDPNGFHNYPEHYKRMGHMLAADTARTLELATDVFEDNTIAASLRIMEIDARVPDAELIRWADAVLAEDNPGERDLFYAREIKICEEKGAHKVPCPVQVIRIGETAFYGMPGEIYVEFGKMLKERSPIKHNIPVNLANGCNKYIPIRELFAPDIYESSIGMSNILIPDAGYIMVDELIAMAEEIK